MDAIEKSVLIYLFNKFNVNIIKLIKASYFTNKKYQTIFKCLLLYKKESKKWCSSYVDLFNYYVSYYKIKYNSDVELDIFDFKEVMNSEEIFDVGWYETLIKNWLQNKVTEEKLEEAIIKFKTQNILEPPENILSVLDDYMKKIYDIKTSDTTNEFGVELTDVTTYNDTKQETFSCGFPFLDKSVNGGMLKKTMWLFVGQPKVGKSIWLSNIASNLVILGKNVLYVSLELDEAEVLSRIGANIFSIDVKSYLQFCKQNHLIFKNKLKEFNDGLIYKKRFLDTKDALPINNTVASLISSNFIKPNLNFYETNLNEEIESKNNIDTDNLIKPGKLFIKEFPTSSLTPEELEIFIKNLEERKKIKIDVVVLDYMNIMKSKNEKQDNLYMKIKQISEELRGIAVRNELCLVTATQVNRGGFEKEDISMASVSESTGSLHTADVVFGIIQTPELKANKKYKLKVLVTRRGANTGAIKEFNINYSFMQLSELDKEEEYITDDYIYQKYNK
jgi:replicative DNA helicase